MLGYEYRVVTYLIDFPVHLWAGKANLGLTGVYIGTKRFSGVISEPKRPHFWQIFWPETQFLPNKKALLILGTPCAFIWAAILWVWASSESYSKIAKRFSADKHTQRIWIFWSFLAQNAIFFSNRNAVFIIATPFKSNWMAILWFWASWQSHSKISKRFSAD